MNYKKIENFLASARVPRVQYNSAIHTLVYLRGRNFIGLLNKSIAKGNPLRVKLFIVDRNI